MTVELLISASNLNSKKIGEVVSIRPEGHIWGGMEQPPNYVHLTITGVTVEQAQEYSERWNIKFKHTVLQENALGYRVLVTVDPAYISASNLGQGELKTRMRDWVENVYSGVVVDFSPTGMTVDLPKPVDLTEVKKNFADIFDTTLDPRRYKFSEADVNTALAGDGAITFTKAQALARVVDKLTL